MKGQKETKDVRNLEATMGSKAALLREQQYKEQVASLRRALLIHTRFLTTHHTACFLTFQHASALHAQHAHPTVLPGKELQRSHSQAVVDSLSKGSFL